MSAQIWTATILEDGSMLVRARLEKVNASEDRVPSVQTDFDTISRKVTQGGTTVIGPTSLTISSAILNTLSTGSIWEADTIGFNFKDTVPATAFPTGGLTYRVEYTFTHMDGITYTLPIDATTLEIATT